MKQLKDIYRYTLKSSMPTALTESAVNKRGLEFDRLWAVFDKEGQALTGREYPSLLDIEANVSNQALLINYQGKTVEKIPLATEQKHGGATGEHVGFADQCPILLTTEASLADLNSRMDHPILMDRFRPNLVLSGTEAWEEDKWRRIKIGECEFKVNQDCVRCVFTTIDPITKAKDPKSEPLRTMNSFRKGPKGGVVFGMHLTPITLGKVNLGDEIVVLK